MVVVVVVVVAVAAAVVVVKGGRRTRRARPGDARRRREHLDTNGRSVRTLPFCALRCAHSLIVAPVKYNIFSFFFATLY